MRKMRKQILIILALWIGVSSWTVYGAANPGEILSFGTEGTNIVIFLQNPGQNCEVQCQIGTSEAEKIEIHEITEENTPIETIVLVDNSLSVVEKYRPFIKNTLSELAANRMDGESFSIAAFSDQINWLVQDSTDYSQVRQAVESIVYTDQETYLTDVLYELLTEFESKEAPSLKRIIIISDGVDNKDIGYTKEELYSQLERTPYPIYTLGCTYKENNEQLKNMFALSRMTGGESWLMDEVSDPLLIVNGISEINHAIKVTVTPKQQDCDGAKKGVSILVKTDEQTFHDSIEMKMPFALIEEASKTVEEIEETQPAQIISESTSETDSTAPDSLPSDPVPFGFSGWIWGVLIIFFVCIALIIFKINKKRKPEDLKKSPVPEEPAQEHDAIQDHAVKERNTQYMENESERQGGTVFLWEKDISQTLILEDTVDSSRRFENPLKDSVLIGYDNHCQICLNYDETVSGEHCIIYKENGRFYVENKSHTNGTFLNGQKLLDRTEIYTGCILGIGRLQMKVSIL